MVDKRAPKRDVHVVSEYGPLSRERLSHLVNISGKCYGRSLKLRLAKHGLPLGYWAILRTLWNEDGLTQSVLSSRVTLTPPTAHAVLKAMEEIGYVTREQKEGNRKNIHVYLTKEGRNLMEALMPTAHEVNDVAVVGISKADLDFLQRTLYRIIANLSADSARIREVQSPTVVKPVKLDAARQASKRRVAKGAS